MISVLFGFACGQHGRGQFFLEMSHRVTIFIAFSLTIDMVTYRPQIEDTYVQWHFSLSRIIYFTAIVVVGCAINVALWDFVRVSCYCTNAFDGVKREGKKLEKEGNMVEMVSQKMNRRVSSSSPPAPPFPNTWPSLNKKLCHSPRIFIIYASPLSHIITISPTVNRGGAAVDVIVQLKIGF